MRFIWLENYITNHGQTNKIKLWEQKKLKGAYVSRPLQTVVKEQIRNIRSYSH